MHKRIIYIYFICLAVRPVFAQQLGLSNQYVYNPYAINPAYAGEKNALQILGGHRKQWIGFEGAPTSKYLSVHSPLNTKMSVGVMANTQERGLLRAFNISATYAYHLQLNTAHHLSFGLSPVYREKSFDFSAIQVDDINDASLSSQTFDKAKNFNAEFGVKYQWEALNVGLSVQNILSSRAKPENLPSFYQDAMEIHALAMYRYSLKSNNIGIKPVIRYIIAPKKSSLLDVGLGIDYQDKIALVSSIRSNGSWVFLLHGEVSKKIQLGYSYEHNSFAGTTYSPATHEFYLGYTLGSKKVNTDDSYKADLEKALTEANQLKYQTQHDSLANLVQSQQSEFSQKEQAYEQRIKELETVQSAPSTDSTPNTEKNTSVNESTADVPVKTIDQLSKGHYVVVKSFFSKMDAQQSLLEITSKGYSPFLVYNKNRGYYYIYLEKFDQLSTALKELENIKTAGFKEAWLYLHQ